jgi:hypothetical protein
MLPNKMTGSIERDLESELPRLYRNVRRAAVLALEDYAEEEAARLPPAANPWTLDDVLRDDWYPEVVAADQGTGSG